MLMYVGGGGGGGGVRQGHVRCIMADSVSLHICLSAINFRSRARGRKVVLSRRVELRAKGWANPF